jgi:plasmid maintenance system antidote protein VapI
MTEKDLLAGVDLLCRHYVCDVPELATRIGVVPAHLAALLTGSPSSASVALAILSALAGDSYRLWNLQRSKEAKVAASADGRRAARAISPSVQEVRLSAGSWETLPPREGTFCTIYVIEGAVTINSASREAEVGRGDTMTFSSELVKVRNSGTNVVRFLVCWENVKPSGPESR